LLYVCFCSAYLLKWLPVVNRPGFYSFSITAKRFRQQQFFVRAAAPHASFLYSIGGVISDGEFSACWLVLAHVYYARGWLSDLGLWFVRIINMITL